MALRSTDRPVFVVDAYTRRLGERIGFLSPSMSYEEIQRHFHDHLPQDVDLYNDYHAQIVVQCKDTCRKKPRCKECVLAALCDGTGLLVERC